MQREKHVDESWKEQAQLEKSKLDEITRKGEPAAQDKSEILKPSHQPQKEQHHHDHSHKPDDMESHDHSPHDHGHEEGEEPQLDFLNYIASLGYQAMIFMGQIPHPMSNKPEINMQQAKFIIDTLVLLRDKTKGNLSAQENEMLNTSVYELQMRFVELSQAEKQSGV